MFEPTNEAETIELYKLVQEQLGWRIVHLQTAFPDAVIENARGQRLVVEFEYRAKNFRQHGHAPARVFRFGRTWRAGPVDGNGSAQRVGWALGVGMSERSNANTTKTTHVDYTGGC